MIKETFIIWADETPGSVYHKLGCQHEHNYSAIVVKGDITGKTYYTPNARDEISIKTAIFDLTDFIIRSTGVLFDIIYLKETGYSYIVYKSMFKDIDLHSKELRFDFFNATKECMSKIKEYNPEFVIVKLDHYLTVIPEGCMCHHCYRIADE